MARSPRQPAESEDSRDDGPSGRNPIDRLVRQIKACDAALDASLIAAINEAPPAEFTEEDWAEIRHAGELTASLARDATNGTAGIQPEGVPTGGNFGA